MGVKEIATLKTRLDKIVEAARAHKRVRIKYLKATGAIVHRDIAAYSYRDGLLFATDTRHNNDKIRSFKVLKIKGVTVLKTTFKPEWDITL